MWKNFTARFDCFFKGVILSLKHKVILDGHDEVLLFEDGRAKDGTNNTIEVKYCKHCKKISVIIMDEELLNEYLSD